MILIALNSKNKLFGINYRSNNVTTICTLIYHRPLDEKWLLEIKDIEDKYKNIFLLVDQRENLWKLQ